MRALPVITVTLCGHVTRRCRVAREQYLGAIRRAGGDPLPIDPGDVPPRSSDALCLTGGGDIDPRRYREPNEGSADIDPARDELEFDLVARALELDVPVLGICRGFQILNVHFGGSLEQHRDGHSPKYPPAGSAVPDDPAGPEAVRHRVSAGAGSLLEEICGAEPFSVNSSHHQVITPERLAAQLRATAEFDGIVEAFDVPGRRWALGVQWHPERVAQVSPAATRIFDAFVRAAERVPVR